MEKLTEFSRKLGPVLTMLLIGLIVFALLFVMLSTTISPKRYEIRVGEVSSVTITAPKEVEDKLTTQQKREEAAASVQPYYIQDPSVEQIVLEDLDKAFDALENIRLSVEEASAKPPLGKQSKVDIPQLVEKAHTLVAPVELTDDQILAVMGLPKEELEALSVSTRRFARAALRATVSEGKVSDAVVSISESLLNDNKGNTAVDVAAAVLRSCLRPNMLIDNQTTEEHRQQAMDMVQPIVYQKGQNIVRQGEVVTPSQIAMLEDLGMLASKGVDFTTYLGVALLILMLLMLLAAYLYLFEPEVLINAKSMSLLGTIIALVMALCLLIKQVNTHLMPVTLGFMLVAVLLKPQTALVCNGILAVLTGILAADSGTVFTADMFSIMLTTMLSGSICMGMVRRKQQRLNIILTGVAVAGVNVVGTFAVGLLNNANLLVVSRQAAWAAGSGVLASILCIGLQPPLEILFNLVTSAKLLELSNPNQPLMRRLLLEAPGTYHHSIIVANLAEAAASAVGANGLLARVGAYYHDIGKLKRPMYFKENQRGDNPHDRTDPRVSAAILTAHPRDGVQMAMRHRIPMAVLNIIQQHHGNTPVLYFYDKALKQGGTVNIDDFRYDGPRPRSREAAIVMLADTVEAAARAMDDPDPEKIGELIRRLVRTKVEDNQLDECSLTFRDINTICTAFTTVLAGAFHERIKYPNLDIAQQVFLEAESAKQVAASLAEETDDGVATGGLSLLPPQTTFPHRQKDGKRAEK